MFKQHEQQRKQRHNHHYGMARRGRMRQNTVRKGMVPIEIILAFPLLLSTVGFVFLFTSICLTRCDTSTQARHHAFRARHLPWVEDPLEMFEIEELAIDQMEVPAKMLGRRPLEYQGESPQASVVSCEVELPVDPVMAIYQELVSSTKFKCYVLGGSWDHQEMPFEGKSQHPPLTIAKNATYAGFSANIGSFANLGGFGAGFSGHSGSTASQKNARQQAKQKANQGLQEAQQAEKKLSSQLSQLENAIHLDHGLIRKIRNSLNEIRSSINSLKQAVRLLG